MAKTTIKFGDGEFEAEITSFKLGKITPILSKAPAFTLGPAPATFSMLFGEWRGRLIPYPKSPRLN